MDGGWEKWTVWSPCSASCAGGEKIRIQTCSKPFPAFGGKPCTGADTERLPCNSNIPCPGTSAPSPSRTRLHS